MEIRHISAKEARPLRSSVLRPGRPFAANVYPLDDEAESIHLGAFEDGKLVTVASFFHEPPPGEDNESAWRLRGMVTLPEEQGKGYGRAVLLKGMARVAQNGGTLLWCNARTDAVDFYRKLNFETEGAEQKTEHGTGFVRMKRKLSGKEIQGEQG